VTEAKRLQKEQEEKAREEEEQKYRCPDDKVTMFELISIIEKYYDD